MHRSSHLSHFVWLRVYPNTAVMPMNVCASHNRRIHFVERNCRTKGYRARHVSINHSLTLLVSNFSLDVPFSSSFLRVNFIFSSIFLSQPYSFIDMFWCILNPFLWFDFSAYSSILMGPAYADDTEAKPQNEMCILWMTFTLSISREACKSVTRFRFNQKYQKRKSKTWHNNAWSEFESITREIIFRFQQSDYDCIACVLRRWLLTYRKILINI